MVVIGGNGVCVFALVTMAFAFEVAMVITVVTMVAAVMAMVVTVIIMLMIFVLMLWMVTSYQRLQ